MSLILVSTPISDHLPLNQIAQQKITQAISTSVLFLVESKKLLAKKWKMWNLPSAGIDQFYLYNEHNMQDINYLLGKLQKNIDLYLISDGGVPAIYDPGRELINACHQHNIKVTATPCDNSIILALALSGFDSSTFFFRGFLPANNEESKRSLAHILRDKNLQIIMDTPYRLKKILLQLKELKCHRSLFLACNLNSPQEKLFRGKVHEILPKDIKKEEFVLILDKERFCKNSY